MIDETTQQASPRVAEVPRCARTAGPVSEAQLREKLIEAGKKEDTTLIISADKVAQHGIVVHVMDLARSNNITKFAVQVEREGQ